MKKIFPPNVVKKSIENLEKKMKAPNSESRSIKSGSLERK